MSDYIAVYACRYCPGVLHRWTVKQQREKQAADRTVVVARRAQSTYYISPW